MTTYTQGQQSIYLEDVWSMEVAASSIVFHGPGADVSVTFMNPAAADAEYLIVQPIWEAAKVPNPYDRQFFLRELIKNIANGLLSDADTIDRVARQQKDAQTGISTQEAADFQILDSATSLADKYEASL